MACLSLHAWPGAGVDRGVLLTEDAAIQARCTEAFAAVNRFEEAHNMVTKVSARGSSTQCGVCMSKGCCCSPGSAAGQLDALGAALDIGLQGWLQLQALAPKLLRGPGPTTMGTCRSTDPWRIQQLWQDWLPCSGCPAFRQLKAASAGVTTGQSCLARCACPATELHAK